MRFLLLLIGVSTLAAQDTPATLVKLAESQEKDNDPYAARRTYMKALELDVNFFPALLGMGISLQAAGEWNRAESYLLRALEANGKSTETLYQLGRVLEARRDDAGAEKRWREVIALDGKHSRAHADLGGLLLRAVKTEEAAKLLMRASELEPDNARILSLAATAADQYGDPRLALGYMRRAVAIEPANSHYQTMAGFAFLGVFDLQSAAAAFAEAAKHTQENSFPVFQLSRVSYLQGRLDEADTHNRATLENSPRLPGALLLAAFIARQREQYPRQREYLERFLDTGTTEPVAFLLLAEAYEKEGNSEKAADNWNLAGAAKVDLGFAYAELAKYHEKSNPSLARLYRDKFEYFRKVAQAPEEVDLAFHRARALTRVGDLPGALPLLEKAAKECGKCRSAAYLPKELGLALAGVGRKQEALAVLRSAPPDDDVKRALRVLE